MIDSLSDLKKLLKLCREQGVTEIDFGGVSLKLGDLPREEPEEDKEKMPDRILSPEELMDWSVRGVG